MIPKIIHYCWLSGDPIPPNLQKCMDTWKEKLPDYEWMLWDLSKFDINSMSWTKEAFENKKYAFAADFIRLYAIYTYGGIYMDMDVKVLKSFDEFLDNDFFTFCEYYPEAYTASGADKIISADGHRIAAGAVPFGLQAAVIGSVKGSKIVKALMDYYADRKFVKEDGQFAMDIIAPSIYSEIAERFGFIYKDKEQNLMGLGKVYPSSYVACTEGMTSNNNYAIHCCAHSWAIPNIKRNYILRIFKRLASMFRK